ncbi:MAG: GNAT family N-acetyltransferase [Betaproteobacteria bacterium]|nr:GNAT family N-acetyltransferase [Betaproteobacteria bacterium]
MLARHRLHPLFEPDHLVVVLGARPADWAQALAQALTDGAPGPRLPARLLRLAGPGPDHGPSPSPSLGSISSASPAPGTALLALLLVDPAEVPAALQRAAQQGARHACLLTGPQATDPAPRQTLADWRSQAQALGLLLFGPATLGFIRPAIGLNAGRMGPMPPAGAVALVSQSGALNGAVLDWVAGHATGFSLVASLGAEVAIDLAEVLDFLCADERTRAVVVYLEAVRDARRFMSALRALALVKPVIVLKGQRGDQAPAQARTHSGALCGSDAVYAAALRRAGALQVGLFTQLFTAARLLATQTGPVGARLGVIANGNGPAVLAADQARFQRLELPPLAEATRERLSQALAGSPAGEGGNPLNLGIDPQPAQLEAALRVLADDPGLDGLLVIVAPYDGADVPALTEAVLRARPALLEARKPLFACWMGEQRMRGLGAPLEAAGVPVYAVPESAVDAWATLARFHRNQRLLHQIPRPVPGQRPPDLRRARQLLREALDEGRTGLAEVESKALLQAFHVPVTATLRADSAEAAIALAARLGFPVALKIDSPDIDHKSDAGGVVLNLRNPAELRAQYHELLATVRAARPQARIDGVTVQPMRESRHARELYVGVLRDPLFGPVIAFGAGGTGVEVVRDVALELPPLNRYLASRLIGRTRVAAALGEHRGAPAIDRDALESLLVAVSDLVCELPWIAGMDINPVIADAQGVVAVDARVLLDDPPGPQPEPHRHLAIRPYPAHLGSERLTPRGAPWTLRAIQPEDADLLQAFTRGLSAQSRYFRFISALAELPARMLIRYTQIDYDRELALVAVAPGPAPRGELVGVVRYLLNPDAESCEFAVAVADRWQGGGVGGALMRAIIDAARARGLRRIEGHVLAVNTRMLGLLRHLGFQIRTDPDDVALREVWLALDEAQAR